MGVKSLLGPTTYAQVTSSLLMISKTPIRWTGQGCPDSLRSTRREGADGAKRDGLPPRWPGDYLQVGPNHSIRTQATPVQRSR
ncbi:hypothetical protein PAXRUDRAFT_830023 [Paxillus rubicundulus Ve08.2h10]|uniref:Uncharacterized protein n=1 Tax=Paxillus rubicundulus Ve08.2h10 TaxID=930991 RepID=A0A0D0DU32_9AGAM|nr:hypothetical protein PAXRUDRAFT_830023 [Paxillus rubicundulus Ve08.2h10]